MIPGTTDLQYKKKWQLQMEATVHWKYTCTDSKKIRKKKQDFKPHKQIKQFIQVHDYYLAHCTKIITILDINDVTK